MPDRSGDKTQRWGYLCLQPEGAEVTYRTTKTTCALRCRKYHEDPDNEELIADERKIREGFPQEMRDASSALKAEQELGTSREGIREGQSVGTNNTQRSTNCGIYQMSWAQGNYGKGGKVERQGEAKYEEL